jgi:division/cell wall cluster transcriptional repressor MraZ
MRDLIGESTNPIDDKNRVTLPTKYRRGFPEPSLVVVSDEMDGYPMLKIYDRVDYATYIADVFDKIGGFNPADADHVEIRRDLITAQEELKYDEHTYRITLTPETRRDARIDSEVHFVGMEDYVEMWDAATHQEFASRHKPRKVFELKPKDGGSQRQGGALKKDGSEAEDQ